MNIVFYAPTNDRVISPKWRGGSGLKQIGAPWNSKPPFAFGRFGKTTLAFGKLPDGVFTIIGQRVAPMTSSLEFIFKMLDVVFENGFR